MFQLESGKAGAGSTSEGVLANFFNSLLSKKTAGGATSPGTTPRPTGNLLPITTRIEAAFIVPPSEGGRVIGQGAAEANHEASCRGRYKNCRLPYWFLYIFHHPQYQILGYRK